MVSLTSSGDIPSIHVTHLAKETTAFSPKVQCNP